MKPSPIVLATNQAVLNLVLYEARQGNMNRCQALGFSHATIEEILKLTPDCIAKLILSPVPLGKFIVEESVFVRLINNSRNVASQGDIERAIRLGATSAMMLECFGISHSETAHRRRVQRIDSKRGRSKELTEEERAGIWRRWQALKATNNDLRPEACICAIMDIAEDLEIPLGNVWSEIHLLEQPEPIDEG